MARIKLTLEYDGAAYVGWQRQLNGLSVQEVMERAVHALTGESLRVECAGRTDAGVHALGQVAAFTPTRALPLKAYAKGLNTHLPADVAVVRAEEVPDDFDPRRWASGKRYRYAILNRGVRSPLLRRSRWEVFHPLDAGAMQAGATHLLGRHDFSAFRAADCEAKHPVRELREARVERVGEELFVELEGTAFLKHMVRNIAGTLVEVGKGKRPPEWVAEVLSSRDRGQAGLTAPAHGLTLVEVRHREG